MIPAESDRKTVSIAQACELVRVSRRTIYNWMKAGKVEYRCTAGGSRRIYVDTLWRDGATRPQPQRGAAQVADA